MAALPRLLTVAVASAAIACTIRTFGSDAGPIDAGTQTVGDQCTAIATAFCMHAIGSCGVPQTLSDCVASETLGCCTGSACTTISLSSSNSVDACKVQIASQPCNDVVNFGPAGLAACNGIPQKQ